MKTIPALVHAVEPLTPTILQVRLVRPNGRSFAPFAPGQYASINFPAHRHLNGYRPFSIASSPDTLDRLEFGIRIHGPYTELLTTLQPGEPATVQGPFGKFTTRGIRQKPIVMLAGGIGVTPFMSMIRTAAEYELPNDITLIFSNRSLAEIPYRQELLALEKANPRFRVFFAISHEQKVRADPHYSSGNITGETIYQLVGESLWNSACFLCGPSLFMDAMSKTLVAMGVPERWIRRESFGVKPGALFEPGSPWPKLVMAGWGAAAALFLGVIYTNHRSLAAVPNSTGLPATNTPTNSNYITPPIDTTGSTNSPAPIPDTNTYTAPASNPAPVQTYNPPPTYSAPTPVPSQNYMPRAAMS